MGLISGIVVFLMVWWTALFVVLPWGNRKSDVVEVGNVASAPEKANILKKFIITTLLTCVIWLIIYGLIASNIINFYDMAEDMAMKDAKTNSKVEDTK
jgi:predicted secreted protein